MSEPILSIFELKEGYLYKRHKAFYNLQKAFFRLRENTLYQWNNENKQWSVNCKTRVNAKFKMYSKDSTHVKNK